MKRTMRKNRIRRDNRGSALLVSLMVIVGLSLLGLGFVAISETETAIAKNQQSVLQTQAVAEAGAKLVVEWFQDPVWAQNIGGMPSNDPAVNSKLAASKTIRVSDVNTGVYKPDAKIRLLEKPYRPRFENRFYGDENSADLIFNRTTDITTIDKVNGLLLGTTPDDIRNGEITEIKLFAPPMVGGTLDPNGTATNADGTPQQFWVGGQRFGVATIKVTAMMFRDRTLTGAARMAPANVLATHAVRLVVGEIPLPIPGGPIQSNTSISFGGDFIVHWGNETSTGTLTNKRNPTSLPWANAYERPHYEHGYEPGTTLSQVVINSGGSGYATPPAVSFGSPGTGAIATAVVAGGAVTAVNIVARGTGYSTSLLPTVTFTGGGGSLASGRAIVGAEVWPVNGATFDTFNYFNEVLDKTFQDPWFGSRAVGDNMADGATAVNVNPQCYPYSDTNNEISAANATYFFQWQDKNNYPLKKKVLFPKISYDFWKRIASQGKGYKGIYYFQFAAGGGYKKNGLGATNPEVYWANMNPAGTGAKLGPGVYFFDTVGAVNPQSLTGIARAAQLTPAESWNSAAFGGKFLMSGFIYSNNKSWGTSGVGSDETTVDATFPGEPYRDIGYPKWDIAANAWNTTCGGSICVGGAGDGSFSYQDLNGNGKFDVVTMKANAWTSFDPGAISHFNTSAPYAYVPKVWKSVAQATADYGAPCTVPAASYNGTNPAPSDCSEPHEPYLNFQYTAVSTNSIKVGWYDNVGQPFLKKTASVTCTSASSQSDCTSNAYDLDGAYTPIDVILDGIFYNEGDYASTGNSAYYGSLLIQGNVTGTGTPDIWFDEKLIKGTWAPPNMPRVIVYNEQTDEEQQ